MKSTNLSPYPQRTGVHQLEGILAICHNTHPILDKVSMVIANITVYVVDLVVNRMWLFIWLSCPG